jgi:predicted TIM-barrel fold metal-dependent hydrolase
MRIFDCHSHWATQKAHIWRTPDDMARQETIWGTQGRYYTEREMMDYMRKHGARVILDLSFVKFLPIDEMREFHDYAFAMQRANPDVIFGHWIQVDPRRGKEVLLEFRRALSADAGFVGLAVMGQSTVPPDDPAWDPFYKLAIDTRTPAMILVGLTGMGQGVRGGYGVILDHGHPRHVDTVAARYPDLDVLAARPAWPWQDEMIAVLLHKKNVSYELHGWSPRRLTPELKREIGRRLHDRIMIGCDFPVLTYEKVVTAWQSLGYTEEVLEKILYRNAEAYFPGAALK